MIASPAERSSVPPMPDGGREKIRVGEIRIAYEEAGTGTPLVFIHGFPHDHTLWTSQLRGLAPTCRCIAPDLRGFGESDVRGPYSMDQYADDIAGLLDALSIERAIIAGLSMGGYVSFALWRRHRDRVLALVLADTTARADTEAGRAKRRDMIALARAYGAAAIADQMTSRLVGESTRQRRPELVRSVHAMLAAAPVEGIIGALEAMMARPDSLPTLSTIDVPTLILVGSEDMISPPEVARSMQAAIPGSRLEIIPQAGHVSSMERPAAFNAVVSEFVGG
jgi:3-oxoadipate enol-lactonase